MNDHDKRMFEQLIACQDRRMKPDEHQLSWMEYQGIRWQLFKWWDDDSPKSECTDGVCPKPGANMNSRIKLVNETTVEIHRSSTDVTTLRDLGDEIQVFNSERFWTANELQALRDCLNCYLDTGSFAALADTSAVPYAGKRMRTNHCGVQEVTVLYRYDGGWAAMLPSSCIISPANLLPLAPPPRVRPYTPQEAAKHLGREFTSDKTLPCQGENNRCWLDGVSKRQGLLLTCGRWLSPETFAADCTWADTNEPCGIVEGSK